MKHRISIFILELIAEQLEIRIIDYVNGGFLKADERALPVNLQPTIGKLVLKLVKSKCLEEEETSTLQNRLIILSKVLLNQYPELDRAYLRPEYTPRQG